MDRYRTLTQHKPSLADPVVKALQDDWEELVGQVNNLIEEKEKALRYAQDYENRHNDTQEDLDRLAQELERIDRMEATMDQKGLQAVVSHVALFLLLMWLCGCDKDFRLTCIYTQGHIQRTLVMFLTFCPTLCRLKRLTLKSFIEKCSCMQHQLLIKQALLI